MILYSAMGNATVTEPHQGFQNSTLADIFSTKTTQTNISTPTSTSSDNMTPVMTLPTDDHPESKLPAGAIAGSIVGGVVLVLLLITGFIILWRRRRAAAKPQLFEISAIKEPQEVQDCALHEVDDPRDVPELPSPPTELEGPDPETTDPVVE